MTSRTALPLPLLGGAIGAHAADQIALAALPLTATIALGAGADTVGWLVAAHAAAWLVLSFPAGLLMDRYPGRTLPLLAQLLAMVAFAAAALFAWLGSATGLGVAAFFGASGAAVFTLSASALLPRAVARHCLPAANARIELARAAMAVSAPLAVGLLAQHGLVVHAYLGAAVASGLAALALLPLRIERPAVPAAVDSLFATVRAGAAFVATQPLLRGIAICAVLWNFAFIALTASFVPFAMERLGLGPAGTGVALAAYGAGAVLAGLTGGRLVGGVEPRHMLKFGPGVSTIAGGALWLAAGVGGDAGLCLAVLAWFLIGFGPILWLICQTTIRQLVTPAALMGRVGATIQIPIYGIRPLGAIAGGLVAAHAGPAAAVVLVLAVFALSTAVIALSPALRALRELPGPAVSPAAA